MSLATRLGLNVTRELGMVLPRTVAGLNESTGWDPASPRGVRQFGEVMLDELVLSGFSLLGGAPKAVRSPDACSAAAEELSALGIDRAHADPQPLRVQATERRRIAGLAYERLTFEHDPALPETLGGRGLGGPARAVVHLCRHRGGPRPWLVWVHGAGQGGVEDLLLTRIGRIHHQLGFNVAMPVQPGHGCRRREWPAYPDMDPLGNVAGMMRAVSEVRAVVKWVRPQASAVVVCRDFDGHPGGRVGVAPGAGHRRGGVVHAHPRTQRDDRATPGPLGFVAQTNSGNCWNPRWSAKLTSVIDPLAVDPAPPPQRRLIVGAWHDRMAMREPTIALQERWGGQLYWYDGSHASAALE